MIGEPPFLAESFSNFVAIALVASSYPRCFSSLVLSFFPLRPGSLKVEGHRALSCGAFAVGGTVSHEFRPSGLKIPLVFAFVVWDWKEGG